MKSNLIPSVAAAAALALAGSAKAGPADERAILQLAKQVATVEAAYVADGYFVHDFEPVAVDDGESHIFKVFLDAGDRVRLRGMGDGDATDIDLHVRDPRGGLVASDEDLDATPLANFTARKTGVYRVEISLPGCAANMSYLAVLLATR